MSFQIAHTTPLFADHVPLNHSAQINNEIKRPAFRYFGSKWTIAPWIIENMPPHTVYVEPFGGGGNVLLRKEPGKIEAYNDLDSSVVNFWRVLRENPDELIRQIKFTPWAREEYLSAWKKSSDPIENARRFFIRSWMSYTAQSGRIATWRLSKTETRLNWCNEEQLYIISKRWREVQIEHDDALSVIQRFDSPTTLFYCDPPYLHSTRTGKTGYICEMTNDQHIELLTLLNNIQGKAMISTYPNDIYATYLPHERWNCIETTSRTIELSSNKTEFLYIKKDNA